MVVNPSALQFTMPTVNVKNDNAINNKEHINCFDIEMMMCFFLSLSNSVITIGEPIITKMEFKFINHCGGI